jgi:TonB family protein
MPKQKNILEQNRRLLLQISLIIALIIMLGVFNIETNSKEDTPNNYVEINLEIDTLKPDNKAVTKPTPNKHKHKITEQAKFKGGKEALKKYLHDNLQYPEEAKEKNIQGRIYVKFKITENGKIKHVKVIRSIHPIIDKEAIRIIKSMPNWIPAKSNNENIESEKVLPIIFINI